MSIGCDYEGQQSTMDARAMQLLVVITCVIAAAAARTGDSGGEVAFKPCQSLAGVPKCKVKAVSVAGCQKERSHDMNHISSGARDSYSWRSGLRKSTCDVHKKTQLNFTITIHSGFTSDTLWSQFSSADLDAPRLDCSPGAGESHCLFREYVRNGCRGTACPLGVADTQRVTDYLKVNPDPSITKKVYNIQWKLWNKSNKKENCCFTFKLRYY